MTRTVKLGDRVVIPWGIGEVSGTVAEVYGRVGDRRVVVALTPELSGYVVDQHHRFLPDRLGPPGVSV